MTTEPTIRELIARLLNTDRPAPEKMIFAEHEAIIRALAIRLKIAERFIEALDVKQVSWQAQYDVLHKISLDRCLPNVEDKNRNKRIAS